MNIKLNNYYVSKGLNTVFSLEQFKANNNQIKMVLPRYTKNANYWFGVHKEGNYYGDKTSSFRDIVQKVEDNEGHHDLFIFDLFQLADYTLNRFYETAKSKNEDVKIDLGAGCEINIYFENLHETLTYPILSINQANIVSSKIYKLNKILEGC